jgi:hypothetical protein
MPWSRLYQSSIECRFFYLPWFLSLVWSVSGWWFWFVFVRNRECLPCSPWSRRIHVIEEFVLYGRRDLLRERESIWDFGGRLCASQFLRLLLVTFMFCHQSPWATTYLFRASRSLLEAVCVFGVPSFFCKTEERTRSSSFVALRERESSKWGIDCGGRKEQPWRWRWE